MTSRLPHEIRQAIRGAQLSLLVMIITILGYAIYSSDLRTHPGSLTDTAVNVLVILIVLAAGIYGRRQSAKIKRYRHALTLEAKTTPTVVKEEL